MDSATAIRKKYLLLLTGLRMTSLYSGTTFLWYPCLSQRLFSKYEELEHEGRPTLRKVLIKLSIPEKKLDKTKDKQRVKYEAFTQNIAVEKKTKDTFEKTLKALKIKSIASPGERHNVLDTTFGGTSAAAPVTAGIAAMLIESNDDLDFWPEAIRAILLATANYQGGDGQNWTTLIDGRDGTGETNAYYAYRTAIKRETTTAVQYRAHDHGAMLPGLFSNGFYNQSWTARNNNAPIRVALAWDSNVTQTTSELSVDLDIWLVNSAGTLVAASTSFDNSYEFLEYTPSYSDGNLTIKIHSDNIPADLATWYGIAWTNHYDCY